MISEQRIYEIEYELLKHRNMQITERTPSMKLFHHYSAMQKDLEEANRQALARKNQVRVRRG